MIVVEIIFKIILKIQISGQNLIHLWYSDSVEIHRYVISYVYTLKEGQGKYDKSCETYRSLK